MGPRVIAIGAHPDDVEISCGGTLAAFARSGAEVFIGYVATGNRGGSADPEELAATRRQEAAAAGSVIGATVLHGFTGDLDAQDDRFHRDQVLDFLRISLPDLIITHDPMCYHPDHRITSELVLWAAHAAHLANYSSRRGLAAHTFRPSLYYMDTSRGIGFQSEVYVDITSVWAQKQQMIDCHQSQVQWVGNYRGVSLAGNAHVQNRARGTQCGVPFAESFRSGQLNGKRRIITWP